MTEYLRIVLPLALLVVLGNACEPSVEISQSISMPALDVADLHFERGAAAGLERDDIIGRFGVAQDVARVYALNWVEDHRELEGQPRICFEVPWLDSTGTIVAYQFIVTDLADCSGHEDLLDKMRAIATRAAGSQSPLVERTHLSSERFFTLTVSSLLFHHPLRDGIKGLPFWLIAFDRLESDLGEPVAVYPGNEDGQVEVVEYEGPTGGRVLFSHHRGMTVERRSLRYRYEPVEAYERFRHMVMTRYSQDPGARLERQRRLWSRYVSRGGVR